MPYPAASRLASDTQTLVVQLAQQTSGETTTSDGCALRAHTLQRYALLWHISRGTNNELSRQQRRCIPNNNEVVTAATTGILHHSIVAL